MCGTVVMDTRVVVSLTTSVGPVTSYHKKIQSEGYTKHKHTLNKHMQH